MNQLIPLQKLQQGPNSKSTFWNLEYMIYV